MTDTKSAAAIEDRLVRLKFTGDMTLNAELVDPENYTMTAGGVVSAVRAVRRDEVELTVDNLMLDSFYRISVNASITDSGSASLVVSDIDFRAESGVIKSFLVNELPSLTLYILNDAALTEADEDAQFTSDPGGHF